MGPINYMGAMPQVNLGQVVQSGLQTGGGFAQMIAQRQAEQQAAMQAQQQAEELARAHEAVRANPRDWRAQQRLMELDPKQREPLQMVLGQMTEQERKGEMDYALRVGAALRSGNPDIAAAVVERRIEALRNAGQDTAEEEAFLAQIRQDPAKAEQDSDAWLLRALPPEQIAETMGKLDAQRRERALAPIAKRRAEAEATSAEVTARFAEEDALSRLEERGWNIKKLQSDIGYQRQSLRLRALEVAISKENNEMKREELEQKRADALEKRGRELQERVAKAEVAADALDNMLNQIQLVKNAPGLRDVIGSIEGQRFYPNVLAGTLSSMGPAGLVTSSGEERANVLALLETMQGQVFLNQFEKLKGAGPVTEKEGEAAQKAFQSLQRTQSLPQFLRQLDEAERRLLKAREGLERNTGVPISRPDVPAARGGAGGRPPLSSFEGR